MRRLAFFTRGDEGFGLGHLQRVSWLRQVILERKQPGLDVQVHCLDSPAARAFWRDRGVEVDFQDDAARFLHPAPHVHPGGLAVGDTVVIDWLDSDPGFTGKLAELGAHVVLLDDYGPAQEYAGLVINALLSPLEDG
ncbi:hypothetical protein IIA79_06395, partial [bacterium]|nr:hypothetical protein [bacterium]